MSTIENGLRADVMRNKMESKDALKEDGYIYVGTGNKIKIEADGNTYEIPETTGMHISEAITKYGANALNPISISSKADLVNTDSTLTELAKKSFAYTVSDSVKLQDAGNDKEEVIIPAWSKGMVLSSGNDLLVTYGDGDISGSFFYNQTRGKWTIVKANIANILDSETMKTTNDGLIPKTSGSVNLGSGSNLFNTVYAKYFSIPGQCLNFRYESDDAVIEGNAIDVRFGYDCFRPSGERLPIDEYLFMNGEGVDDEDHLTWIRPKGITPYKNNEINFNIKKGADALIFGGRGSKQPIKKYIFDDGQGRSFTPVWRGVTQVTPVNQDSPADNVDSTYSYEFIVPDGSNAVPLGNDISLSTYTKGAISSSGWDCAMWACDTKKGRFLFKNSGSWSVLPVEAPSFNATSDKRLKENIVPFTSEKSILDLPVYTFNFKSDKNKKKHVGCLAQDLQEICPDLVNEDSQGYLSIEESKITYLLLEEVKELKKQVEELKGKINELEGK